MKQLILLFIVILGISCKQEEQQLFIKPDKLPVYSSAPDSSLLKYDKNYGQGIHKGDNNYYLKSEGFINNKTTIDYVKANKWYVVDNYMNQESCWFITVVHNNHYFNLPNITLEEYYKYHLNTFINGDELFNILNRVNYWK